GSPTAGGKGQGGRAVEDHRDRREERDRAAHRRAAVRIQEEPRARLACLQLREKTMSTPTNRLDEATPGMRRSTGAWLIRKEKPLGPSKPPKRPPAPGGINAPGGSAGGGMICPGTDP